MKLWRGHRRQPSLAEGGDDRGLDASRMRFRRRPVPAPVARLHGGTLAEELLEDLGREVQLMVGARPVPAHDAAMECSGGLRAHELERQPQPPPDAARHDVRPGEESTPAEETDGGSTP